MDTIDETEPIGADDIASSTDTSATDTQPEESGEVATESEETGQAEVTLLAGKYKTAEELEKAYGELQSKFGEQGQKAELANLLEQQTGMNAQQIASYIKQQEQAQLNQQIQDNPAGYAIQEVQNLKAQLALKEEQAELDAFITGSPEYAPFKEDILEMGLNFKRDMSYQDIANKYFGKARAQGQQDAYKRIEVKQNTQATGASQAAPKSRLTSEDMDNMSVAELEAILPHADISNRPY